MFVICLWWITCYRIGQTNKISKHGVEPPTTSLDRPDTNNTAETLQDFPKRGWPEVDKKRPEPCAEMHEWMTQLLSDVDTNSKSWCALSKLSDMVLVHTILNIQFLRPLPGTERGLQWVIRRSSMMTFIVLQYYEYYRLQTIWSNVLTLV